MQSTLFQVDQVAGPMEAELHQQVEAHKYFLNQTVPDEISMEEAFESWSRLVYGPLSSAIDEENLQPEFPEVSEDELFLMVSRHWHFLKKEGTVEVSAREAVLSFGSQFAQNPESRLDFHFKQSFL